MCIVFKKLLYCISQRVTPQASHNVSLLNMPFKSDSKQGGLRLFSDDWSEKAALFKRLMKIHSIHQYYDIMALRFLYIMVTVL